MDAPMDLSKFKAKSEDAIRLFEINKHPFRSNFQRDRDRILYSKEFRRLSGKTQIFVTGSDDHMRTRLTHTLEVSQIAETISDRLKLDSMLTRAIALGHDIGHTPFGHVGERTLNYIMNGCFSYYGFDSFLSEEDKGFKHNFQGVRVACILEQNLDNSIIDSNAGLNLTRYTLWGIMNHSSLKYKQCEYCKNHKVCRYKNSGKNCKGNLSVDFYNSLPYKSDDAQDWTFEGIIVAYADEIAQRHHDIEDGIIAGIIDIDDLCDYLNDIFSFKSTIREEISKIKERKAHKCSKSEAIQALSRLIVDTYVTEYCDTLAKKVNQVFTILNPNMDNNSWKTTMYEYATNKEQQITRYFGFSQEFKEADNKLSEYLSAHILDSYLAQCMDGKASYIIRQLVKAFLTNTQQLPDNTIIEIIKDWNEVHTVTAKESSKYMTNASRARKKLKDLANKDDPVISIILLRRICDHIAGMTDQYAISTFERLYGSKGYM